MTLLTPDQLGEWLQISKRSVYELCSDRSQRNQVHPLPFLKIAGKLRFSKDAITEWLTKLQERAA